MLKMNQNTRSAGSCPAAKMGRGQWGNELECQGMSKTNDKGRGCKDRRFTTGRCMGNALSWGRDINSSACSEKRLTAES